MLHGAVKVQEWLGKFETIWSVIVGLMEPKSPHLRLMEPMSQNQIASLPLELIIGGFPCSFYNQKRGLLKPKVTPWSFHHNSYHSNLAGFHLRGGGGGAGGASPPNSSSSQLKFPPKST